MRGAETDRGMKISMCAPSCPGPVPGIHVFSGLGKKDVDGRDKPGHEGE
jgi:hypothetical protein